MNALLMHENTLLRLVRQTANSADFCVSGFSDILHTELVSARQVYKNSSAISAKARVAAMITNKPRTQYKSYIR